jgi:hypothetical protein
MAPSELLGAAGAGGRGASDQHSQCVGMERCNTFASPLAYALWAPALHSYRYVQLPPQVAGHGSLVSDVLLCCAALCDPAGRGRSSWCRSCKQHGMPATI